MGAVTVGGGGSGGAFVAFSLSGIACRPRPRFSASPPRAEAVAAAVAAAAAAMVAADVTAASARGCVRWRRSPEKPSPWYAVHLRFLALEVGGAQAGQRVA